MKICYVCVCECLLICIYKCVCLCVGAYVYYFYIYSQKTSKYYSHPDYIYIYIYIYNNAFSFDKDDCCLLYIRWLMWQTLVQRVNYSLSDFRYTPVARKGKITRKLKHNDTTTNLSSCALPLTWPCSSMRPQYYFAIQSTCLHMPLELLLPIE